MGLAVAIRHTETSLQSSVVIRHSDLREASGLVESSIERRMGELVRRRGGLYYKFVSPGQAGVPDRIIVAPGGQCVFVELKTETGRLSNIQKWQIGRMRDMGLDVRKVSGWEQARALVDELFPEGR